MSGVLLACTFMRRAPRALLSMLKKSWRTQRMTKNAQRWASVGRACSTHFQCNSNVNSSCCFFHTSRCFFWCYFGIIGFHSFWEYFSLQVCFKLSFLLNLWSNQHLRAVVWCAVCKQKKQKQKKMMKKKRNTVVWEEKTEWLAALVYPSARHIGRCAEQFVFTKRFKQQRHLH